MSFDGVGFEIGVSGFGFWVQDLFLGVSSFWFRLQGLRFVVKFRVSCFKFRVEGVVGQVFRV